MIKILYTVGYYYDDIDETQPDFINLEALFNEDITTDEMIEELNEIIHSNFYRGWLIDWRIIE